MKATLLFRKPPPGADFRIRSVEDLINQSEIKYGTINHGVIVRAFRQTNDTALKIMWRKMQGFDPSAFTRTNQQGIDRVRDEKYAFVLPHTTGEYMTLLPPCDLITVDRFLLNRGYAIAVQKDSELLAQINFALGILRNINTLDDLYRKWWRDGSRCDGSGSPGKAYSAYSSSTGTCSLLKPCVADFVASSTITLLLLHLLWN